jgi:hypothetical protein
MMEESWNLCRFSEYLWHQIIFITDIISLQKTLKVVGKKYSRQVLHVSTPSAGPGQGFSAPSFCWRNWWLYTTMTALWPTSSLCRHLQVRLKVAAETPPSSFTTFFDTATSCRHSCSSCLAPLDSRDNAIEASNKMLESNPLLDPIQHRPRSIAPSSGCSSTSLRSRAV